MTRLAFAGNCGCGAVVTGAAAPAEGEGHAADAGHAFLEEKAARLEFDGVALEQGGVVHGGGMTNDETE